MHTILAASYLHMNHARRRNSYRRVQEAYHWQRAIQLYQVEMQNPIGAHNTNALMGSCIFMGINTLMPVGFQPQDSWVFTSDPADLNWLALQGGLRCMIELTQPFIADSIWGESFQASAERLKPFQDEVPGREGMHSALADLCEIDDATTPATNPYHWHVQLLSRMLMLKPFDRPDNYNVFVTWMGQILPEFITLLRGKDERAMLILSWWMALMCAMASFQVWIHARIVPECRAICMYLEQNSTDAEILRLMRWPAQACGYHEWMPETFEDVII
ncbi:hypothetical protein BGW36DRAFT_149419 [Talaromyces proteolyticus]|uniref:C6 transcription factor n=1 Tax=Talaromyces proteolyticus TaxID=1131652 RepID=A0AAD4Q1K8_9EURO|nr:uncharacterized protein BGW36DRAFT_149419 [Talaromyces proteolyticus]KAH8698653.1 hypothetical protein BGW36DRAFT_149419 [Talaromyces proteolyticus]